MLNRTIADDGLGTAAEADDVFGIAVCDVGMAVFHTAIE